MDKDQACTFLLTCGNTTDVILLTLPFFPFLSFLPLLEKSFSSCKGKFLSPMTFLFLDISTGHYGCRSHHPFWSFQYYLSSSLFKLLASLSRFLSCDWSIFSVPIVYPSFQFLLCIVFSYCFLILNFVLTISISH